MTHTAHFDMVARTLGLQHLPLADRNALLEEIDTIVFRAVLFRVISELDESEKEELHTILDQAGDNFAKPYEFLKSKIKNFNTIVDEELEKIKEESLRVVEQFL